MNTEQLYTLAMMQLLLVLLLASSRVKPPAPDKPSLGYLQLALSFDALSWLLYLWPTQLLLLFGSSLASAINFWLLLLFALSRAGRQVKLLYIVPPVLLQALLYTYLQQDAERLQLHLMTLVTAVVALPSAWLFSRVKTRPTKSDFIYSAVMLCWFLICLLRSILVEFSPAWVFSGYLVSQLLWPGITAAYGIFALTGYLEETQQRLEADSHLDPLTGLLNRRGLLHRATSYLAYLQRQQQSAAILMLDLDHFKQVNDRHGHDCGDQVLIKTAQLLQQLLRQSDLVARWGGEEFLIILPNTDKATAEQIAGRLCTAFAGQDWQSLGLDKLTVSIGGAALHAGASFEQALCEADLVLYQAKQQGRNQWVFQPTK
ncbi:diguanylate cyclase [Alishewanella sp. BS5-314]|uniref:GGDEF domain-containing protein n=1 Tax=Alishewanella sp. BS5-314 TaxID=2755587 RepID=UPI0021BAD20F|nr:GGDEF domain-containing protein [Alishewanella sp. BS5-314]MCT8125060.1 diguanylate cyclase [Alishewanella sp. BS5-314]